MSDVVPFLWYSESGHTLHSGGESLFLLDARAIFDCEPLREFVLDTWIDELNLSKAAKDTTIYGVPTGGVPWASALAERLDMTWCGFRDCLSGPVWIVDDVVTTGGSIMEHTPRMIVQKRMAVVDRGHNSRVYCVWRMPLP